MTDDKSKHLVPRLRFPEFQEAPAWSIEPLGRLFHERQEAGFPELPLLSVTDRDGVIPQEETNRKNTANLNKAKYLRVVPGDIVYNTMRMWEGRSARVGMEGVVSPAYTVCQPNVETNSYFFAYYFKTRSLVEQFRKYSQGLVKDTLNLKYKAFSLISVGSPPPNEQQKIADCLGSLDDLISAEGQKLEALREHKQGLMQQIFPQSGETVPRLRFPEFSNGGEWEEIKIGDLSEVKASGDLDAAYFSNYRSTTHLYPVYSNAVENAGLYGYYSVPQYKKNSVTITARGTLGVAFLRNHEFMGIGRLIVVSDLRDLDPCYLKECWNHLAVIPREVTSIPQLTTIAVRDTVLPIPSLAEQQRIATCLSSLDARLVVQVQKINALKTHKQGLLQQLFPNPEAE